MNRRDKFVDMLTELASRDHRTLTEISRTAGMSHQSVQRWTVGRRSPNLHSFEAVLNTMGYELAVRKRQ